MLLHPVIHLLATRPAWLAEHAQAYAELGAAELADAGAQCGSALLLGAVSLCLLGVGGVLAGVATMLWALTPDLSERAGWLLLATPALPLALALAGLAALWRAWRGPLFLLLRQQLQAEFTPQELLHLSLVVAYFNGFSRCAVALGGMPDEMPRTEISVPR